MTSIRLFAILTAAAACCAGQTTTIPGSPITLAAVNAAGSSFNYSGVLTQSTTITLNASGQGCLQNTAYCTNAAGVVVVAGSSPVGQATTYNATYAGTNNNWTYGSLLMSVSGVGTVQLFPASAGNGLGSSAPPTAVSFSGIALSSLGFANFSVSNPTITFFIADTNYPDNTGSLTFSGSFTTGGTTSSVPALSDAATLMLALLLLAASVTMLRRRAA